MPNRDTKSRRRTPPNEAHTRLHEREPVALWLGWICKLFVGHPGWLVRINNGWLGLLRTVYKPLYNVSNTSSWYLYATHCDYHLKELGMTLLSITGNRCGNDTQCRGQAAQDTFI